MPWYQTKDAEDVIQHESLSESEKKERLMCSCTRVHRWIIFMEMEARRALLCRPGGKKTCQEVDAKQK